MCVIVYVLTVSFCLFYFCAQFYVYIYIILFNCFFYYWNARRVYKNLFNIAL